MKTIGREAGSARGRLLVVEDDRVHGMVVGRIAAKLGYDVLTAPSFEVAATLLQQHAFSAMTLDLSLGEHDGVELLRLAAERGLHGMPIVIISGCEERVRNSTRRVAEGLGLALVSCLSKPLHPDELRLALYLPPHAALDPAPDAASPPDVTREQLLSGLAHDEFFVELQPKIDLSTGRVVGAEALARWRSPDLGAVSPAIFIPAVERFGLMPDLTRHVLSASIARGRRLIERHPGFTIAVNISASLMDDLKLPERIEAVLKAEGVPPGSLIVEVTESVAMSDVDRATDVLVRMRIKGIGAAIDDFGTGYWSLAALARLPFSELKIDQSFVKGCDTDPDMMKIIEASVGLGRAFGMKVVAEGIESPQARARVAAAGCHIGQGYLFAPPMRPDRFESWMPDHAVVRTGLPAQRTG